MKIKILEKDSTVFGLILSIALPLILFAIVYLVKFHDYGYSNVWLIPQIRKSIPKIVSLCIFPNGLIFYGYILGNRLRTMRGMLSGTMILALFAAVLFFIL
ncbi:MAG: hypothetical protein LBE04_03615 [Prevotellaceae bacterium]|jgi:hypothetical protein|nr:hypothetical protein [Prevotellaceae bacterium]